MKKLISAILKGQVQGVWFRVSAQKKAQALGICGFVQNRIDGTVYIEAEGEEEKIEEFLKWCNIGPEMAEVNEILVRNEENRNYKEFVIKK